MAAPLLPPAKPRLLVGSTAEGRPIAELIGAGLREAADVTLWCRGTFDPPSHPGNGILEAAREFDFAAFVVPPDELASRAPSGKKPQAEGIILALGVFLGALGRTRTFIVTSTEATIDLPSELRGVTLASYRPGPAGLTPAALACACAIVREQLRRFGAPSEAGKQARAAVQAGDVVARRRRRPSLGNAYLSAPRRTLKIADISLSGAFLETYGELPERQMLDVELWLEDGSRAKVTAKVVRIQHPQWGRVGGVGVTFVRFEADARETLARYIDADPSLAAAAARLATSIVAPL